MFVGLALCACVGSDGTTSPQETASALPSDTTPFSPPLAQSPTVDASATPPLSPPPADGPPRVEVIGLFVEPRDPPTVVSRPLGERPPSSFRAWDGSATVLYDVEAGTEKFLGLGQGGRFSPDSTRMAWIRGSADQIGEAILLDLATMEQQTLGSARLVTWVDDSHVALGIGNNTEVIDLATGTRTFVEGLPYYQPSDTVTTPDGYALRQQDDSEYPFPLSSFSLVDPATGELLLSFEAHDAVPAGPRWLAVATEVQFSGPVLIHGYQDGTVNIFLVSVETGEASFVATSLWGQPNWPLAADAHHVAWTDAFCTVNDGVDNRTTKVFDRSTGEIADLGQSLWLTGFTDDGVLATGAFGPQALIDLDAPRYRTVLPGGEPKWSPNWRYASIGRTFGHGGLCP
jgi:hypothetical protein